MKEISWRVYGIGFLAACALLLFLHAWDRNLTAQIGGGGSQGESACDNVDNDGTGTVDEGCYACKADERFVVGNRTYCFSFASFGMDLSAADAECRSFGGQLASYTDGETRADIMDIVAKYVSIAHKQPIFPQALLIKNACLEMTAAFRQPDAGIYLDTDAPPGVMDCSHPILMHSGSQEGKLNDGTGGDGNGAVCEITDGWCCITDGQACVPMTLKQCDASGIGFAQDQPTCNILCGISSSSSSSRLPSSISSVSSSASRSTSSGPSADSSGSPVSSHRSSSSSAMSVAPVSSRPASSTSSWSSTGLGPSTTSSPVPSPFSYSLSSTPSASSTSSLTLSSLSLSLLIPPQCSDGIDNDGDSLQDDQDPGCHTDANPSNPFSYDPDDSGERDATSSRSSGSPSFSSFSSPFSFQNSSPSGARTNGDPCQNGTECQSSVCLGGMCIPCTLDLQCPAGSRCLAGQCRPFMEPFFATLPTGGGICGDSLCSVMENAASCPQDCRAIAFSCTTDEECDTGLCRNGSCAPCAMATDCPRGWQCLASRCLPQSPLQQAQVSDEWQMPEQFQVPGVPYDLSPTTYHLQPIPAQPETGPELLAVMTAGAAGGWAWMRRRRTIPSLPHIAR